MQDFRSQIGKTAMGSPKAYGLVAGADAGMAVKRRAIKGESGTWSKGGSLVICVIL